MEVWPLGLRVGFNDAGLIYVHNEDADNNHLLICGYVS